MCLLQNQSSNEGFETKIQDLEGFWEMVSIQVQEVEKNFNEISLLHDNGWIQPDQRQEKVFTPSTARSSIPPAFLTMRSFSPLPHRQATGPKNRSRKNTPKESPVKGDSGNEESAAAKEAARRQRLLEAKKKMQSERKAAADETDIAIFVPETRPPLPVTHDPI